VPALHIDLTREPLPRWETSDGPDGSGAEILFHGRVRGREGDREIIAIDYEAYEPMARLELERLAAEVLDRFPIAELSCSHRIGVVPVGEASLRVVLRSTHRAEAIEALAWFVRELKVRVPIWKWGLTAAGERFPSQTPDTGKDPGSP
jgi:molybdopterin synthase catalytic subunit